MCLKNGGNGVLRSQISRCLLVEGEGGQERCGEHPDPPKFNTFIFVSHNEVWNSDVTIFPRAMTTTPIPQDTRSGYPPLSFFWSSKHLSLILLIFFRLLTSSLMHRFCREPSDTTLVLSLNGLFCTSLTNCASCECVRLQ